MEERREGQRLPSPSDTFKCDGGRMMTWAEMTDGLDPEDMPRSMEDAKRLLWSYGALLYGPAQIAPAWKVVEGNSKEKR